MVHLDSIGGQEMMTWKGVEGDHRIFYSLYDHNNNSWGQEIEWRVLRVAKKHTSVLEKETGIEPSLTGDDLKLYLQEVLSEVKAHRKQSDQPSSQ
jgi:hypothetical protein